MLIIGVDPGLTGALSLICTRRGLLECEDIPTESNGTVSGSMKKWVDVKSLHLIICEWSGRYAMAAESVHAFIERPVAMPNLPAQTIASQFDTFGVVRTLIGMRADVLTPVAPRDWKSFFGLSTEKDASRAVALALYPTAPIALKKHHNRAEAILIGHFGRRRVE